MLSLDHADPDCDLNNVPGHGRQARFGRVLANASGFGEINA
jgi:3-oxoacyl-(acyl-carrier-protein) synthase